jgi:hypothetical protein
MGIIPIFPSMVAHVSIPVDPFIGYGWQMRYDEARDFMVNS